MRLSVGKVLVIIALLSLAGCSNTLDNDDEQHDQIKNGTSNDGIKHVNFHFIGTIDEIINEGSTAIVHTKYSGSGGRILVNLSVNSDVTFQVNDTVKVGYDGVIMESNPAQIHTLSVELID